MSHEHEKRRARRRKAPHTIDVMDVIAQRNVGHLINLSESGMLIVTHEPITPDGLYQFQFSIAIPGQKGTHTLNVGAHELWSDEAGAPGQRWTGFRFIEMGPEDLGHIRDWVDAPDSQYVGG